MTQPTEVHAMDSAELLAAVARENRAVLAAAEDAWTAPVPTCPGWDVAQLVRHLGAVHRWAAHIVRSDLDRRPDRDNAPVEPRDPAALRGWFTEGLETLVATLAAADPSRPCWSFRGPQPPTWWRRRQALEAAVHRVDVELARGVVHPVVDGALAVTGITEHFEIFLAQERPPETLGTEGRTIHLHATDVEGEWLVRLRGGGVEVTTGHARGDAALRGTASDLMLVVWHRLPLEAVEVIGDPDAAGLLLDHTVVG